MAHGPAGRVASGMVVTGWPGLTRDYSSPAMIFLRPVSSWGGDAGGLQDSVPPIDILGCVRVAMAARDAGGERKVGGDLPEGHRNGEPTRNEVGEQMWAGTRQDEQAAAHINSSRNAVPRASKPDALEQAGNEVTC